MPEEIGWFLAGVPTGGAVGMAIMWTRLSRVERDVEELKKENRKASELLTAVRLDVRGLVESVADIKSALHINRRTEDQPL